MKRYTTYLKENEHFEMGLAEAESVLVKYKIGDGGFGEVWRAVHLSLPKNYALKHIDLPRLIDAQRIRREEKSTLIERIKREAGVQVESEYVVKCYGYREIDENFFLLSDFVAGESLRVWIDDHQGMAWPVKKAMCLKILQGVRDLHRAGIVHRDLKPSNILISLETQTPKIIDFGLVKLDDSSLTMSGDFSGSTYYKDPDLVQAWEGIKAVDQASDVYALGILLYEMIMGQNPWSANRLPYEDLFNQIAGNDNVLDIDSQFRLDATPEEVKAVKELLRLSTCFERSARLQTVEEMLARLGASSDAAKLPSSKGTGVGSGASGNSESVLPTPSPFQEGNLRSHSENERDKKFFESAAPVQKKIQSERRPFEAKPQQAQPPAQKKAKKSSSPIRIFFFLILAAVAVYALWGDVLKQFVPGDIIPVHHPTPTPTATPTAPPSPTPTVSPVAELLAEAQSYLEASQFVYPAGENALENFQQVLGIDPANAEAEQGLAYMLQSYARWVDHNCIKAEAYYPGFLKIAEYVHDTLHDDELQEEAVKAERAFQECNSPMIVPREGDVDFERGEIGGYRRR